MNVDIIIPCHNSHATLDRTLGSILCQRVLPSIKVTLVRDGGDHYDDIIKRYSPVMNIQEIGYDDNGGPGKARNYGLTHTNNEFITFIDSDDVFSGPFAILTMINEMFSTPGIMITVCDFIEEIAPSKFKRHTKDITFVHGKMYRREYLERNNILQNEKEGSNEDVGFNILAMMLLKEGEKVKYSTNVTNYWLCNPNSIVRSNKDVFDYKDSFQTFVKNIMYVYSELRKRNLQDDSQTLLERVASLNRISNLYHEKKSKCPQYAEDNLKVVKEFYKKEVEPYEHLITDKMIEDAHNRYPFKKVFQISLEELKDFIKSLKN